VRVDSDAYRLSEGDAEVPHALSRVCYKGPTKEHALAQNPSFIKRQKELARLEWQQEKQAKRKQRKLEKDEKSRQEETKPDESSKKSG
jgi:hypothetical protein